MSALAGRRIVVTRALRDAGGMCDLLRKRGAISLLYPCIDFAPPQDHEPLEHALIALGAGEFDWLVLTSAAAARAIASAPVPPSLRIAAIGSGTADATRSIFSREADYVPPEATRVSLAAELPLEPGQRILLPQSDLATIELSQRLEERGANVRAVQAYRTVCGNGGVDLPQMLCASQLDAITITSGSCAANLRRRLGEEGDTRRLPDGVLLACLGASVAEALKLELGNDNVLVAHGASQVSLVDALERHYEMTHARAR